MGYDGYECVRAHVCVCVVVCAWCTAYSAPTTHGPLIGPHLCTSSHSRMHPDLMNDDINSVQSFLQKHNNTVGKWLKDSGYHTSFLGKVQFPALSCILCVLERVKCVDTCMYIFAPP